MQTYFAWQISRVQAVPFFADLQIRNVLYAIRIRTGNTDPDPTAIKMANFNTLHYLILSFHKNVFTCSSIFKFKFNAKNINI